MIPEMQKLCDTRQIISDVFDESFRIKGNLYRWMPWMIESYPSFTYMLDILKKEI